MELASMYNKQKCNKGIKAKMIRIIGLLAIISYMTVILSAWIYANLKGYTYFSAGEPDLMIKYYEWIIGFTGIIVAVDYLRKELKWN